MLPHDPSVASLEARYCKMKEALCRSMQLLRDHTKLNRVIFNFKQRYPSCLITSEQQQELNQHLEQRRSVAGDRYTIRCDLLGDCRAADTIIKEVILRTKYVPNVHLTFDSKLCSQWKCYGINDKCVRCFSFLSSGVLEHIEKGASRSCHMCPSCRRHLDPGAPGFLGPPKPSPPPPVHCNFRYPGGYVCRVNVAVVQFHGHCPHKKCNGAELEGHQCPSCGRWPC